ncbi:sugar ABC transporter permease [Paenibacillus alba]|uniref:sugar ABC transporter permease n=1 Tax=Paenibacillus alba TaxID=1197127 RepID=UPI0015641584|nr:sugar ABC transporter permease [Paenibacillus alba]NQX71342.1 sugar ABC transporter permease [Paenibacillus alba]
MRLKKKTRENLAGYLFILPNLLGFSIFILFSLLFSLVLIFTNWDYLEGVKGLVFIGLNNVKRLIHDETVLINAVLQVCHANDAGDDGQKPRDDLTEVDSSVSYYFLW